MNKWNGRRGRGEAKLQIGPVLLALGCESSGRGSGRYTVRCPFHDDRSPSATVDENDGWFHCHVCGIHEDAIGLVRIRDGSSFGEARREARAISDNNGRGTQRTNARARKVRLLSSW